MNIEEYMINQIRENLRWLVENTDVAWEVVYGADACGVRFRDSVSTITTIWEDEA